MSFSVSDPTGYARRVARAAREGLDSYLDICAALREGLDAPARDQRVALRELQRISEELGLTLISLCRTLDELGEGQTPFEPAEDPRIALDLLRPIAESLILVRGQSLAEVASRPLADPDAVAAIAARPPVAAFLAFAGPRPLQ